MARELSETEAGLPFGTEVTVVPSKFSGTDSALSLLLTGPRCSALTLRFSRAGHNHYEELYAYCFTFLSGEELWIELPDAMSVEERLASLKAVVTW